MRIGTTKLLAVDTHPINGFAWAKKIVSSRQILLKSQPKMPMSYMRGFNKQNDEMPGALCISGQVRR